MKVVGGAEVENELHRIVGARMRARRRILNKTLAHVARDCGVSYTTIQKYEDGLPISASRLWSIAQALNVPVSYFFQGLTSHGGLPIARC